MRVCARWGVGMGGGCGVPIRRTNGGLADVRSPVLAPRSHTNSAERSAEAASLSHAGHTEPSESDIEDLRLIALVRAGGAGGGASSPAWSQLLRRYQDRLFGVCLRMLGPSARARQTAADLTQDAMVKIIQGLPSYDGSAKFSTWAIRVTMNVCLSHLRGAKLRQHASLDGSQSQHSESDRHAEHPHAAREPNAASGVLPDEDRGQVAQALATLDPEQRAILVLRDVRGLDYDQIAHVLGVAVGTVKSRLFRARAALREALEASGFEAK